MLTLRSLIPSLDDFLIGDSSTHKILNPDSIDFDVAVDARVDSLTAKDNVVVVWLNLNPKSEDILDFN